MRALIVALMLFAEPASGAIAVEWRGAESPDEPLRLSVREAIAKLDGRPREAVPDQALARARVAASREYPATIRELRAQLRVNLDDADAAYRAGHFADAEALLELTLDSLHDHPELAGAAASAREAHLLAARIAWARGELGEAERALGDALRLDPEARLAARQAPPELIERYQALQTNLLGSREHDWITPQISIAADPSVSVEIDGVPGLRPVPPGNHFMVVFRDGCELEAAWRSPDLEWAVPDPRERISSDPDAEHEAMCRALALELLVLAERRGASVGLQGYRCGRGYGPRWSGPREQLAAGARIVVAGPFEAATASLAGRWSALVIEPVVDPVTEPDPPRPWYRRGWIWGTSAGVAAAIVGGVVTGVVLGARQQPSTSLEIDANTFIGF